MRLNGCYFTDMNNISLSSIQTLSDILDKQVVRHDGTAEVIIDYYSGEMVEHIGKPIKLYGFDPSKTDFEILEQAFLYIRTVKDILSSH